MYDKSHSGRIVKFLCLVHGLGYVLQYGLSSGFGWVIMGCSRKKKMKQSTSCSRQRHWTSPNHNNFQLFFTWSNSFYKSRFGFQCFIHSCITFKVIGFQCFIHSCITFKVRKTMNNDGRIIETSTQQETITEIHINDREDEKISHTCWRINHRKIRIDLSFTPPSSLRLLCFCSSSITFSLPEYTSALTFSFVSLWLLRSTFFLLTISVISVMMYSVSNKPLKHLYSSLLKAMPTIWLLLQ